jgi:threonine dehydrogenase-like Zn-dependent dehydrogenase
VLAPVTALALITRYPLTVLVRARQILGQSVAVMGLGMIGQITLRLFSAAGAYPLIGIDRWKAAARSRSAPLFNCGQEP